jgi:tetratricopeptide (TPR) repeat protein
MKDKAAAERYWKDGLEHLGQAIVLDPKFADAIALEAGLRGLGIMLDPSRAMVLGGEIEEGLSRAAALAPKNPRIALLDGINTFNKPKFVGGGLDKALVKLKKSQELFAAEQAKAPAIDWGMDDAYAWAGRASAKLEKTDAARASYQKALEVNPGNTWVKYVLLPELDQAAKAKP